jgi:hypothetical protein
VFDNAVIRPFAALGGIGSSPNYDRDGAPGDKPDFQRRMPVARSLGERSGLDRINQKVARAGHVLLKKSGRLRRVGCDSLVVETDLHDPRPTSTCFTTPSASGMKLTLLPKVEGDRITAA